MDQLNGTVEPWVILSFCSAIFMIGFVGVLVRRNILVILMSIELMLNAVNLTFVTYSKQLHDMNGELAVFFIITVAAAESAVGLGLIIAMFRTLRTVDTDEIQLLRVENASTDPTASTHRFSYQRFLVCIRPGAERSKQGGRSFHGNHRDSRYFRFLRLVSSALHPASWNACRKSRD